jgi:hypothetical protein
MRVALLVAFVIAGALLVVAQPASASGPVCENVASGPDYVLYLCVDPGAPCRVYTVTYGHEGATATHCVLA